MKEVFSNPDAFDLFLNPVDIGTLGKAGSCVYHPEDQSYTVAGSGANIWGERDSFHFAWMRMAGNFIVTARAAFEGTGVNPHRKMGWMVRTSLEPSAAMVSAAVHGDGLVSLQYRRTAGGMVEEVKAPIQGADVIQLERAGNSWMMSAAKWGEPFMVVKVSELALGDELYVGLYVCSHENTILEQAVFENVRVVKTVAEGFDRGKDPFGSRLEILDVESGLSRVIYRADSVFEAPNWMRDGKSLIFNRDGHLYRFDLEEKQPVLIDTGDVVHNNNDHVLSFDGTMLAVSSHADEDRQSLVYTVPVGGGQPKRITPTGPSYLHGWSPDGKYLVFTGLRNGDYDVYRVPSKGGEETRLTTAPGLDDGPEYTPDGKYIYFNSVRSGRMQIWRMKPDGSEQEQLTDDEYNNWFPHISPDGRWVIFVTYLVGEVSPSDHPAAKRVYLRVMPLDGGKPRVAAYLYGGQGTMNVPSWSPDGKKVAFVTNTVPF